MRGRAACPNRRTRARGGECRCRGRIKAGAHGARVRRDRGAHGPQSVGPRPPDLEDLLRRGQDRLQQLLPGGYFSGMGIALVLIGALAIWGLSGFFRVQSEELGVVLRFGKHVRDRAARPELSSALSDRDRAAAEGAARLHHLDRHDADRRSGAARPHHARRAGRKPDADRRREHRRRRFHRVVADQAGRRRQLSSSTSRIPKAP